MIRTRQEVFNKVYEHAKQMKAPAYDKAAGCCMYRSETGPCLIGSLITNEAYSKDFEQDQAGSTKVMLALQKSGVKLRIDDPNTFLNDLQECHDKAEQCCETNSEFKIEMMSRLKNFAKKYKLEVPEGEE